MAVAAFGRDGAGESGGRRLRSGSPLWWAALVALLAVVGMVAWLDHVTGREIAFSFFYLPPILAAGWWLGPAAAVTIALVAGGGALAADISTPDGRWFIPLWNGLSRLVMFGVVGTLAARTRSSRDRLRAMLARERELARVDPMTGLPNRRAFIERLMMEASRCRRSGQPMCVAYLDLDNFKRVNDRYGHAAGDELLCGIARYLMTTVRAGDMAARLGGDEFAILFWNADRGAVSAIARRVIEGVQSVGGPFPEAMLGASIGIADFERVPDSAEEILKQADQAMYAAKSAGKGRLIVNRVA